MGESTMQYETIGIVGCGKMGRIILEGILRQGLAREEDIYATETHAPAVEELTTRYPRVHLSTDQAELMSKASLVIICVKPNAVDRVLSDIKAEGRRDSIVVSIAAGYGLGKMERAVGDNGDSRCIRVMPNTACQVSEGMSVISPSPRVPEAAVNRVAQIFSGLGGVMRLREDQMDIATALCGSGPGLILTLIEGLSDGGVLGGLTRNQAVHLVAQAMLGTAKMVLESHEHPAVLKDQVCTPGGCTIAGVVALEEGGIRGTLARAVQCTAQRASDLSDKK